MNSKLILALLIFSQLIFSQQKIVSGVVQDSVGEIIIGATIIVEGTNTVTNTNLNGKYSIKANLNDFLVFSFTGKTNQRISADKDVINVQLLNNDLKLTEVLPYNSNIRAKRKDNYTYVDKTDANTKIIRGFVFDNSYFTNIPIPVIQANIEVKGTERKTMTDTDGKFEIEVTLGDKLIISGLGIKTQTIIITNINCYKIYLNKNLLDYPLIMSRRVARINKRYYQKIEREVTDKLKKGFYDCMD